MNQTIWILRDRTEPKEGPYWSAHIAILAEYARTQKYNVIEISIDQKERCKAHDLILFRSTSRGVPRHSFIQQIQNMSAFSINKCPILKGTKQSFFHFAKKHSIPIPKTWLGTEFLKSKKIAEHGFVVKHSRGAQGKSVFFCSTYRKACAKIRMEKTPTVVQEFIPLQKIEDIRLFMVGETLCGSMKRVLKKEVSNEFRANISLGTSDPIPYLPTEEMIEYAKNIMKYGELDMAGIDIGQVFLLVCLSALLVGLCVWLHSLWVRVRGLV